MFISFSGYLFTAQQETLQFFVISPTMFLLLFCFVCIYLSACLSFFLSLCLSVLSIHPSIHLSIHPPTQPLSYLFIRPSARLPTCLPVHSFHPSIHLRRKGLNTTKSKLTVTFEIWWSCLHLSLEKWRWQEHFQSLDLWLQVAARC